MQVKMVDPIYEITPKKRRVDIDNERNQEIDKN